MNKITLILALLLIIVVVGFYDYDKVEAKKLVEPSASISCCPDGYEGPCRMKAAVERARAEIAEKESKAEEAAIEREALVSAKAAQKLKNLIEQNEYVNILIDHESRISALEARSVCDPNKWCMENLACSSGTSKYCDWPYCVAHPKVPDELKFKIIYDPNDSYEVRPPEASVGRAELRSRGIVQ